MNILVTLNSAYVPTLCVMLKSLIQSNKSEKIKVYVAHSSLTQEDFFKIRNSVKSSQSQVISIKVDDNLLANAPTLKRISKETYYRLIAKDFLPTDVKRILYIDPDTIVLKSLKPLYNIDFEDNLIAGASHVGFWLNKCILRYLNIPKSCVYINAGVLMLNIEKLRQSHSAEEIFEFISKNEKRLHLADQDVINCMYAEKILNIDAKKYNCDEKTVKHNKLSLHDVRQGATIVHFDGKYKPWKIGYKGILKPIYDEFATFNKISIEKAVRYVI